jgi:predicted dehydrogenase
MFFLKDEYDIKSLFSRRDFIQNTGKGILAAALTGGLTFCKQHNAQPPENMLTGPAVPKDSKQKTSPKLSSLNAPTEKTTEEPKEFLPHDKRIGYAIVGLGHLALEQILPGFASCKKSRPVALVSGNADKAKKTALQYGIAEKNIYNYENYDQLKNNPEVDVIYIVLPNGMHAEYTVRGAKAGKHILCEKPMANSVREAEEMIRACKQANKKLMIAYRIQYEPNNAEIRKLVKNKEFGNTKIITSSNCQNIGDPSQWRLHKKLSGGGALPDIGLYCINTIRYLTGEEPAEVYGKVYSTPGDPRFKEVEENVMFQMIFPSGIRTSCTTSYGTHESRSYRVFAEKGFFGMDPAFPYKGLKMYTSHAEGNKEILAYPKLDEKDQFALEIDHMSDCILNNKTPDTPGEEGLQDQKIMEAIYKSAREGKPVALDIIKTMDTFRRNSF